MMTPEEAATRALYCELQPGDKIEIVHDVKVGRETWAARTQGTVVRKERRRHGLHYRRNRDDKAWSDVIVFARDGGELSTVTVDEYTRLTRLAAK